MIEQADKMTYDEFNEKVVTLRDKVYRFAVRLTGNDAQGEDVVQDVMERMWRKRLSLGGTQNVEAFVMQTTRNCCYDYLRHKEVEGRHGEAIFSHSARSTAGDSEMERSETGSLIAQAIAALPEKQREAIHLRDVEGYEFDEISQIMGCDVPTARVYLSRARKTVSEKLKNHILG